MGQDIQAQKKQQKLELWEGITNIVQDREASHTHKIYGENIKIFISQSTNNEKYVLIRRHFNDEYQIQKSIKIAQKQKELHHESLVRLINFKETKKTEFCATFWISKYLFEFVDHDLEQDIKLRRKYNNTHYEQNELMHICSSVIAGIAYMEKRGIYHGDINPKNIFIDLDGRVRIMPNMILKTQHNLMYQLGLDTFQCYLSPKQLDLMKNIDQDQNYNIAKSDLFSLGVVMLEAATLSSVQDIYHKDTHCINDYKLQYYLKKVKQNYTASFTGLLELLLDQIEERRPPAAQFFKIIEELFLSGLNISNKLYSMEHVLNDPIQIIMAGKHDISQSAQLVKEENYIKNKHEEKDTYTFQKLSEMEPIPENFIEEEKKDSDQQHEYQHNQQINQNSQQLFEPQIERNIQHIDKSQEQNSQIDQAYNDLLPLDSPDNQAINTSDDQKEIKTPQIHNINSPSQEIYIQNDGGYNFTHYNSQNMDNDIVTLDPNKNTKNFAQNSPQKYQPQEYELDKIRKEFRANMMNTDNILNLQNQQFDLLNIQKDKHEKEEIIQTSIKGVNLPAFKGLVPLKQQKISLNS